MLHQIAADRPDPLANVDFFPPDRAEGGADRVDALLRPVPDLLKNGLQGQQRIVPDESVIIDRRHILLHFLRQVASPVIMKSRILLPVLQRIGHRLVQLVLQEFFHQLVPRVKLVALLILFLREQHPALDVEERGRHDHKLTRDVHIRFFHPGDIREVLVGNGHNRNIININFVNINQVQQEVQRALELLQLYRNRHNYLFFARLISDLPMRFTTLVRPCSGHDDRPACEIPPAAAAGSGRPPRD